VLADPSWRSRLGWGEAGASADGRSNDQVAVTAKRAMTSSIS
jgi:hypothetical protein